MYLMTPSTSLTASFHLKKKENEKEEDWNQEIIICLFLKGSLDRMLFTRKEKFVEK